MMTSHDIRLALFRRKIKTQDLANQGACTQSMIRAVIRGNERSSRIRKLIAKAIGKSERRVFGA